jgi:hypothetical protein
VAEAIGRDAAALLFAPRVMPMDAYPVADLPGEAAIVLVASTTGQARGRAEQPRGTAPW